MTMRAMVLPCPGARLEARTLAVPARRPGEVLVRVGACGVCRTDLHIVDGELAPLDRLVVPGHQIVGRVVAADPASGLVPGARVGIPWLGWTCGECAYCRSGRENLCDRAQFTGYHRDGGFAEYAVADARYCFPLAGDEPDVRMAPLLCAGLIGYRALRLAGEAERLGFFGFGAAAHILVQVARAQGRRVFAFTRPGDAEGQAFARALGAEWAGASGDAPPERLDAALIFAPAGELVPIALRAVAKGGTVVCAGIHMTPIPSFQYEILWEERTIRSVANLTRRDGEELLALAARLHLRPEVTTFPLASANEALAALRAGAVRGAAVLDVATS